MKKVYLHIGSNKTGTTSIQDNLYLNKQALEAQDVCYPGNARRHHLFYFAAGLPRQHWPRQFNTLPASTLEKQINTFFDALQRDIDKPFSTYFLSTEYLFIHDDNAIRRLMRWLAKRFDHIEVVAFVRQPSQHYSSAQQQVIKACHRLDSPAFYHYPFQSVIQAWQQHCHVNVFKYDANTDSLATMANLASLDMQAFASAPRANSSLCIEQMLMLEKIQKVLYADKPNVFREQLGQLQKIKPERPTRPNLKAGIADYIDINHRDAIEWINATYQLDFSVPSASIALENFLLKNQHCAIRDIYHTDEDSYLRYECHVLDKLLDRLTKMKKNKKTKA